MTEKLAIDGGKPVRIEPLPWELPGSHWIGEEEAELVSSVVEAHSPFRFYGPDLQGMVDLFEKEWCESYGHKHALGVSSGSAALGIALSALRVGPGDEVLLPGYMWVSCAAAIVRVGAIPRLVDIDETFCIDPDDLRAKIGPHSRAILCVHMSGAPGRIDEIAAIAREAGLGLVEDCAQTSGASFKGQAVGTFGDISIFSFQLNKNMTAGEGGMVATNDDDLYRRITALHDLGYPRTDAGRLDTSDEDCQLWGYGARMSELTGAFALAQSRKLPQIVGSMRSAKWRIREALKDIKGLGFRKIIDPAGDAGPFLISIYEDAETCAAMVAALRAEGMAGPDGSLACLTMKEWGLHWYFNIPSLVGKRSNDRSGFPWTHPDNKFAEDYEYRLGACPQADDLHNRSAILTIASNLTQNDTDDIISAFRKVAATILAQA